jgi:signal transduction histidine kinase/ActR/RegA family two-component response regulator
MPHTVVLNELQRRLRIEQMIAEISTVFLRETSYEKALSETCRLVGEATGVSRVYIFENFEGNSRCCNTVEWVNEGIKPVQSELQDVPYETIRYWQVTLERRETIRADDVNALPPEVVELLSWQDIRSILVVPLVVFDEWSGFLGLDVCSTQRSWRDDDASTLQTIGRLISSALEKRELEQQLIHSERLSAVGSLAAGVAHEYNNLHAGIMGLIELTLEDESVTPPVRKDLNRVLALIERGVELTRRLLSIARQDTSEDLVDLRSVVTDTVALTNKSMRATGVSLNFACSSQSPWVKGSRADLGQVLLNLLLNAVEALQDSPEKHIDIHLRDGPSNRVQLDILDTGPGVSEAARERLFEPFFTTKGKLGGGNRESTGLGLSISSRIAVQHGGTLTVRNRVGRGAHFRLELPFVTMERVMEGEDSEFWEPTPPPVELGRIGVVDDEPPICEMLTRYLSRMGHYVEAFETVEAAQAACLRRRFDIFLVDFIMPESGGQRFVRWMADRPAADRAHLVIMSGKDLQSVAEELLPLTVPHLVQKPFVRLQVIDNLVQKILREQKSQGGPPVELQTPPD